MPIELDKKTIQAWRNFVATPEFVRGTEFLRSMQAPAIRGKTPTEIMETGIAWGGYQSAINDLTDVLTAIPVKDKPIEAEPELEK